jgi:hypothetical protein
VVKRTGEVQDTKPSAFTARPKRRGLEVRRWKSMEEEETKRPKDEKIKGGKVKRGKVRKIND